MILGRVSSAALMVSGLAGLLQPRQFAAATGLEPRSRRAGGLITRTVSEGPPLAVSYALTDRGRALMPALERIADWARENLPPDEC